MRTSVKGQAATQCTGWTLPERNRLPSAARPDCPASIIETCDLVKEYAMGDSPVQALRGISLRIDPGEIVAITGPSGSGKSTLMNLLGFLDTPTSGTYRFNGLDVSGLGHAALAGLRNAKVGFVFQSFSLLPHLTAEENVELPLVYAGLGRKRRRERARDLANFQEVNSNASPSPAGLPIGPSFFSPMNRPAHWTAGPANKSWKCCRCSIGRA
jgi:putative ABC transport system ATP-binding protein